MRDSLPKDLDDAARPAPRDKDPLQYYNCAVCGQQVDRVNLDQVYHHDARSHAPLSAESSRYDEPESATSLELIGPT